MFNIDKDYKLISNKKNNKEVKFVSVIIGGGKISEQHLRAMDRISGISVEAICDLSPALAEFTAKRFKIDAWYTDYNLMLSEVTPNFVHVLTPPATHNKIVRDCLDAGANVIVEKPVALSNKEFKELYEYASLRNLLIVENHNYRFNRPVLEVENAVKSGKIGSITNVEIQMALDIRSGGRYSDPNMPHPSHKLPAGVLHEYITHLVYLMLLFMPEGSADRIDLIKSAWRNLGGGEFFKYDDLDSIIILNGIHGRLKFSCRQWPDCFSITVNGTKGAVTAELYNPVFLQTIPRNGGKHLTPLINSLKASRSLRRAGFSGIWGKVKNVSAYDGLFRHLELFYKAMQAGSEPPVGYRQMDETSRIIDALLDTENMI